MSVLPSSRAWLTSALDPFHDYQYDLEGLPDERSAPSVVQLHNQTYTLTAPACAAANWDASITYTGLSTMIGYNPQWIAGKPAATICNYDHAALVTDAPFGSLTIRATTAGADLLQGSPVLANSTAEALGDSLFANGDCCRTIAVGIEIINTTADIYKQGSLAVAMLPDTPGDLGTTFYRDTNAAPWSFRDMQADKLSSIPLTAGQLRSIPGSNTWAAKDGVYMIPRMTRVPRNLCTHNGASRICEFLEYLGNGNLRGWTIATPQASETEGAGVVPAMYDMWVTGFSPMQAQFTGLSHETTLTINFRTIVEYFPPILSPLLPLAHPSAPFDPAAFELYSRIVSKAPYAVPVRENAFGDYFRKVLAVMRSLAPSLGIAMNSVFPGAAAIGGAVGELSDLAYRKLEKPKQAAPIDRFRAPTKPLPSRPVSKKSAGAPAMQVRKK